MPCGKNFKNMNRNTNPAMPTGPTDRVGAGIVRQIRKVTGKRR